ncbi:hypothetical protein EXIGLDRAFT_847229 [Exidia glandulosa HHB12029]|uniref:Uncharacterized protein n=1 Tax=Exidia glandulosa HHB12029 TaxID=1314781 RepID=A0A166N3V5_EXIGL|nr:hypothetical protein EXIGLDRAFT_847229 [Exidia glandulosa HHB12029]
MPNLQDEPEEVAQVQGDEESDDDWAPLNSQDSRVEFGLEHPLAESDLMDPVSESCWDAKNDLARQARKRERREAAERERQRQEDEEERARRTPAERARLEREEELAEETSRSRSSSPTSTPTQSPRTPTRKMGPLHSSSSPPRFAFEPTPTVSATYASPRPGERRFEMRVPMPSADEPDLNLPHIRAMHLPIDPLRAIDPSSQSTVHESSQPTTSSQTTDIPVPSEPEGGGTKRGRDDEDNSDSGAGSSKRVRVEG